jgi:hypothetical protein
MLAMGICAVSMEFTGLTFSFSGNSEKWSPKLCAPIVTTTSEKPVQARNLKGERYLGPAVGSQIHDVYLTVRRETLLRAMVGRGRILLSNSLIMADAGGVHP